MNAFVGERTLVVKNNLYQVIAFLAILAYFMPLLVVWWKKLRQELPFLLFALFWAAGGLVNLVDFIPGITKGAVEVVSVLYNMLDIPMALSIFHFTSTSSLIRKICLFATPVYLVVEIVYVITGGLRYDSLKVSLGLGLITILVLIVWEIIRHLQKIVHTSREKAMLFIYAALLFEYGTYVVIYIFDYYLTAVSNTTDNFIIYYISTIIALILATSGYLIKGLNKKPERHLAAF